MRESLACAGLGLLFAALLAMPFAPARAAAGTARNAEGGRTTHITVRGRGVFVNLVDGEAAGFLSATRDEVAGTSAIDFAYAQPDGADPQRIVLVAGAGEIPNEAFTVSRESARLSVTTPFEVTRCLVSLETGEFDCAPTGPVTFDLLWTLDGYSVVFEKTRRTEYLGPVVLRSQGEFEQSSASVSGNWGDRASVQMAGELLDTKGRTLTRELEISGQN